MRPGSSWPTDHIHGFVLGHAQDDLHLCHGCTDPACFSVEPREAQIRPRGHHRHCRWISPAVLGTPENVLQTLNENWAHRDRDGVEFVGVNHTGMRQLNADDGFQQCFCPVKSRCCLCCLHVLNHLHQDAGPEQRYQGSLQRGCCWPLPHCALSAAPCTNHMGEQENSR